MAEISSLIDHVYYEEIHKLAEEGKNEIFYNSGASHAKIVLTEIVLHAQKTIDIICQDMSSPISNSEEYIQAMKSFLKGGSDRFVRVFLLNYKEEFRVKPIFKTFSTFPSQVTIKKAPSPATVLYDGSAVNITVADETMFRIETDIEKKIAFGNFNDPKKAKGITAGFEAIFNRRDAIPVELSCQ